MSDTEHPARWTIWVCPDCGSTNIHAANCGMFPGDPVEHGNRVEVVPAEQLAEAVEALREIATRPAVERNPDGDDQAAHTMQMIAREALDALRGSSSDGV
jgi:hypothetical protein